MAKYFTYFILVFCMISFKSFAVDSLTIDLRNKISVLETDSQIQKAHIESLDKANDKILNSTYFTIGAVLTLVFGLAVWNSIANYKINNKKIDNIKSELKSEFDKTLINQIDEIVKNKFADIFSLQKHHYEELNGKILDLKIDFLKSYIVTESLVPNINTETFTLVELLGLALERYKTDLSFGENKVQLALSVLVKYTDKYKDLPEYERDMILEKISKVNLPNFGHYINEIKKNINVKE